MKKTFLVLAAVAALIIVFAVKPGAKADKKTKFHTDNIFEQVPPGPFSVLDTNEYFLHPSNCRPCHGYDPFALSNVDLNGVDVNLYDDWETSMMGLAGVDPLWKAKVSHEILTNPSHTNELQTLCTSCHAPMGHFTAMYHGATQYTLADLANDSLGQAGVSCGGCHSIGTNGLGNRFTGDIPYDTSRVEFGPFDNPVAGPMQLYVGITPTYSTHVSEGRMCSTCHTLISHVVDLNGVPTGASFVEQATYHEWKNSSFPAANKVCQTCHMPPIEDPVVLVNGASNLPPRAPFNLHQFAGGNSFMVKLIKDNKLSLNVSAADANFDSTLSVIQTQLTKNSILIKVSKDTMLNDTAFFDVTLTNKTGHKFPTGYPSRRAVLRFVLTKPNGDTLFATGLFNNSQEVVNIDPSFEKHYDMINDPAQVQIYEMVMTDVNGDKTTVLERSAMKIKDNRIPPKGFTTTFYDYDTCYIAGDATHDADFNIHAGTEGTGVDIVHFHIPLHGYSGLVNVRTSVYYQAVPPAWLSEMFGHSSALIDTFRTFYNAADKSPILMAEDSVLDVSLPNGIASREVQGGLQLYPNPLRSENIRLNNPEKEWVEEVKIFNAEGKLIRSHSLNSKEESLELRFPSEPGIYFVQVKTAKSRKIIKIVRL